MPSYTDCDTLTEVGLYYMNTSGQVTPEEMHKPTGNNCGIIVIRCYMLMQIHLDQQGKIHVRCRDWQDSWSSWAQLV